MKSSIVAVDKNMGIGAKNHLLWGNNIPDDLAYFKKMTASTSVIMGRNTFDSIGIPLPHRENIVVSSSPVGVSGVLTATRGGGNTEGARSIAITNGLSTINLVTFDGRSLSYNMPEAALILNGAMFAPARIIAVLAGAAVIDWDAAARLLVE